MTVTLSHTPPFTKEGLFWAMRKAKFYFFWVYVLTY